MTKRRCDECGHGDNAEDPMTGLPHVVCNLFPKREIFSVDYFCGQWIKGKPVDYSRNIFAQCSAVRTLQDAGYTYKDGASRWKPPLGISFGSEVLRRLKNWSRAHGAEVGLKMWTDEAVEKFAERHPEWRRYAVTLSEGGKYHFGETLQEAWAEAMRWNGERQ